jgi:predicted CopG family antitoxin
MSTRHTVNLNNLAYDKLKRFGNFGESYSDLIIRLLEIAATFLQGGKEAK